MIFFDEPDFLRKIHVWLETADASNLAVGSLATFLAEHNVVGLCLLLSQYLWKDFLRIKLCG